jgi:hypothetical protein
VEDEGRAGPDLPERLSRAAAWITLGFFVIVWPATLLFLHHWACAPDCLDRRGPELIGVGVGGLIVAPIGALLFLGAGRLRESAVASDALVTKASNVLAIVLVAAFAASTVVAILLWAYSSSAFVAIAKGGSRIVDSLITSALMAIYTAAVCGGSWMAAIGAGRLEAASEREK